MQPAISIVTPLYNKAPTIQRALDSVLAQDYPHFEYIVIDDGSTDAGAAIVAACADGRVQLVRQDNGGVSAARNRGIALARAPLIAFLDADDAWLPTFLSTIVALRARFPQAGAYATGYCIKNPGLPVRPARFRHVPEGGLIACWFRAVADGNNPVWSSAVALPRATLDALGGFPQGVRLYEDLHLWSRIALAYPIAYAPQPLAIYYRDAEQRACNEILPEASDLAFAGVIDEALAARRLHGDAARAARQVVARYALLNALKNALAGRAAQARAMAWSVPVSGAQWQVKRLLVTVLSYLPQVLVTAVWKVGRALKRGLGPLA